MGSIHKAAWAGAGIIFLWLFLCAVIGVRIGESAVHPLRKPVTGEDEARTRMLVAGLHARLDAVSLTAADGAVLKAWLLQPRQPNGDAVLLLHGVGDNRLGMLMEAEMLLRHGYAALLPDARAQGDSGGALAGYGVLETGDIDGWIGWLRQTLHPGCVDAIGDSMGAGQLLTALGENPPLCAVVGDSAFANFREVAYDRIGQRFGTGPWLGRTLLRPVVWFGFGWVRWRDGVDLDRAAPAESLSHTRVPVLLIHGTNDSNLPPRHAAMIVARNPGIPLWLVPGAEHCGAMGAQPMEFEQRVVDWLGRHRGALAN